ncbi:MAG: hypothetical protein O7A04_06800 [Acidobacteria bacterium]|nr:hypothetical protein [Acidobacteriota bacterium]
MAEPFAKLYRSIFSSSIMEADPVTRLVWSYLLALGYPTGKVDATPISLSRRFNLPLADVKASLAALSEPDPSSRTPDEDGRRIVLLDKHRDWGWQIVNFEKYLAKRDRAAYQAEYYKKRKDLQGAVGADTGDEIQPVDKVESTSSTDSTHKIEIEIEIEKRSEEEAATAAGDPGEFYPQPQPRDGGRASDLSFPVELLQAIPDIQELWAKSARKRKLSKKGVSIEAQQEQIDELAAWIPKFGADEVRAEIKRANRGTWQSVCYKDPSGNGDGRRKQIRPQSGDAENKIRNKRMLSMTRPK